MSSMAQARYSMGAIILHWVTAILVIFMIVFGEDLIKGAEHDPAGETYLASIHVSIGVSILVLTLLRLLWRAMHPAPPYPDTMKPWELMLAKFTHLLFYILLLGVPLTGWLAFSEWIREEPAMTAVSVFGLFSLPIGPAIGKVAKEIHEVGSNAMMILVILHVLAALKHQFLDGDGILRRMSPH
ncbi:MAG: cytochrome b [Hyphomicrobiales bacterium]